MDKRAGDKYAVAGQLGKDCSETGQLGQENQKGTSSKTRQPKQVCLNR
jgi:hypothetical protein